MRTTPGTARKAIFGDVDEHFINRFAGERRIRVGKGTGPRLLLPRDFRVIPRLDREAFRDERTVARPLGAVALMTHDLVVDRQSDFAQHHVLRLQIAVQDPATVRIANRAANRDKPSQELTQRERPLRLVAPGDSALWNAPSESWSVSP